jgi:beta-N-acetylhexosaminidase
MTSERGAILGRVMIAFHDMGLPPSIATRLRDGPAAGLTLFRYSNVTSPGQVRELTDAFQRAADAGAARRGTERQLMLVGADQEGGQLIGLGDDTTAFAGNMALGAVGDEDLAERVGAAIGLEARAMGVNVVYAPVLDLATERENVSLGIRSFGSDPATVARLGAAFVRGMQAAGVAASMKHFPGLGEVVADSHHGPGVVLSSREDLESGAFVPFRAAVAAGARIAMSAHVAVPVLSGDPGLPSTLSSAVMDDVLRGDLGFEGVTISDALDMRALAQGAGQAVEVIAAIRAGVDLLLCSPYPRSRRRVEATLEAAAARGLFDRTALAASAERIASLRGWLASAGPLPDLDVVGSAQHLTLARELAERSLTLVAGDPTLRRDSTVLAIMPRPANLTPADTSSSVEPGLGQALRMHFAAVDEMVVEMNPSDDEIAAARARAKEFDAVVVGTIDGHRARGQLDLVGAIAGTRVPTVAVALRTPWDVAGYPAGVPAVCTYSISPESLAALARALAGQIGFPGRLPVDVPGLEGSAAAVALEMR